jgi:hypothetical protein
MSGRVGWLVLVCAACACRRGPPVVANLIEAQGMVEQAAGESWRTIAPIVPFVIGDLVRTGARSSARVRIEGAGVLRMADNTRLRFRQGMQPRSSEVGVEVGMAELESKADMLVATGTGRSRIPAGSRVQVRADAQGTRFDVLVGRAILVGKDGEKTVQAGEVVRIRVGSAVVEHLDVKIGEAFVETEAATPATSGLADAGVDPPGLGALQASKSSSETGQFVDESSTSSERQHADVTIAAGESATLHAGGSTLHVRLRFDHLCPGNGTIELGPRKRIQGTGSAVLRLRTGKLVYRLRCADDKNVRSAVLTLKPDCGNVPLPKRASANTLEADGRRYTVLYQTRPPALVLDWPSAPAAARALDLHLQGAGVDRILHLSTARQALPSGSLAEGAYTWWYTTSDGRSSPKTSLQLRFDNTAPTAQFFRTSGETTPGTIAVDGVTVQGSKVSSGGTPLPVDEHGRFRGALAPFEGDDAVAVRVESAPTGVHYYVRRAAPGR